MIRGLTDMAPGLSMFLSLFVLLLTGMPIAAALGLTGLASLVLLNPDLIQGAAHSIWSNSTSFVLTCVPLYILLGEIVQRSGVSVRFYRALTLWVRWLPGGLLHTNIVACAFFAAISGSSVGTAAAMGTVAIPELTKLNYGRKVLYGSLAAGGTLGILIPPSVSMIIYGALTEQSIGHLFMAGVIPGILMMFVFMAYIVVHAKLDPTIAPESTSSTRATIADLMFSLKDIIPLVFIMAAILGGLYLGWATPTEVAAIGVLMSIVVSIAYGTFGLRALMQSAASAVRTSTMVIFVILGAQIFSFALFSWGATREMAASVLSLPLSPTGVWIIVVVFYLFLGCFIDAISMMVLTLGVVYPIMVGIGYDPIWFGVTLTLLLEIGLITPPVGMNLYTIQAIAKEKSFGTVVVGSFPFVILLMIGIAIFSIWPDLVLWLPRKMFMSH
jgi:C4-dicarboxylate transporter, DctM subunit